MTELAPYEPPPLTRRRVGAIRPPADWLEAAELAKSVANTEFVPRSLRGNPAAITGAILYGDEVGLGPMQSLAKIAVIDGRPSLAAEAQRALILQAGHELVLEESTLTRATWAGRRHGTDTTTRITWTLDDAKRAGLAGRPAWRTYPRQMLSARASAELARAIFADVIGGLAATEELDEFEAEASDGTGTPAATAAAPSAGGRTRRRRDRQPAPPVSAPPPPPDEQPPLPGEQDEPPATEAARRRMHALFREAGIDGRADRLAYTNRIVEREISSSVEMTASEVAQVSAALAAEPAAGPQPDAEEPAGRPVRPPTAAAPAEQASDDDSYQARRAREPATDPMRQRLDTLVSEMLERRLGTIDDLWHQVASYRRRLTAVLVDELHGRAPDGRCLWQPLADSLRRDEAGDLAAHLEQLRQARLPPTDDIPH